MVFYQHNLSQMSAVCFGWFLNSIFVSNSWQCFWSELFSVRPNLGLPGHAIAETFLLTVIRVRELLMKMMKTHKQAI